MDPWGEQRADLRMAQIVAATLAPHSKTPPKSTDYLLFPDERNELPDDVTSSEQEWMLQLARNKGD